jgi:excinuclease UvrABC ATPase subunit
MQVDFSKIDPKKNIIKGAEVHNLKMWMLYSRNKLVVITGLSGSGKSSLADTLYAEGQRRYVESLSSYATIPWKVRQAKSRVYKGIAQQLPLSKSKHD